MPGVDGGVVAQWIGVWLVGCVDWALVVGVCGGSGSSGVTHGVGEGIRDIALIDCGGAAAGGYSW